MKKVTDLKENEGILCSSEEELDAIIELCSKENIIFDADAYTMIYECTIDVVLIPFYGIYGKKKYYVGVRDNVIYPASDFLTPTYTVTREQLRNIVKENEHLKYMAECFADNHTYVLDDVFEFSQEAVAYFFDEEDRPTAIELLKILFPNYEKPKQKKEITVWVNVYESGNLKGIYQTEEVAEYNDASKQCKTVEGKLTYEI